MNYANLRTIMNAVRVVAVFNEPLNELYKNFEMFAQDATRCRDKVANAVSAGSGVFEALTKEAPGLATAIHDFVYQIALPLHSIVIRDRGREEVAKAILKL